MRVQKAVLWLSVFAALHVYSTKPESSAIVPRQETGATITTTTTSYSATNQAPLASTSIEPSTTGDISSYGSQASSSSESEKSTVDASNVAPFDTSSMVRSATGTIETPSITSTINGPLQATSTSASDADSDNPDALPLQPKITPALAIAGVILILAGLTYTLIGIKSKRIQIFLSSAFLTSLSVTVLVIYVMNPPVRPAVQGAYLIAAFMTGVILGAGSLVFKEVTEGLGCLLGGFCLSMWLLALRPGGTLESTGAKVILVAAFTLAVYALSFSHYTRPYGLIGATSFAGATATVLGFDCFSKAGLKEFWLYIWNLNQNLFPLNTNTYPITRGMKVELAAIILMWLLGGISQLKLWRVIKDRRQKQDAMRIDKERERDQMEESIGRHLEEGNGRERAQWEAVHGDHVSRKRNDQPDSGLGTEENNSLRKASVSVKDIEGRSCSVEIIELKETTPTNKGQASIHPEITSTTITAIINDNEDSSSIVSHEGLRHTEAGSTILQSAFVSSRQTSAGLTAGLTGAPELFHSSPPIIPLPFTIPSSQNPQRPADKVGANSAANGAASDDPPKTGSDWKADLPSGKADRFSYAAESKGSSLAATIDDDLDELHASRQSQDGPLLRRQSLIESFTAPKFITHGTNSPQFEESRDALQSAIGSPTAPTISDADNSDPEEFQRPVVAVPNSSNIKLASSPNCDDDGVDATAHSLRSRLNPSSCRFEGNQAQDSASQPFRRSSSDAVSSTSSLRKEALERVPSQLAHLLISYRTNEWAKHISTADDPEFDTPEAIPEGVQKELPARLEERPALMELENSHPNVIAVVDFPSPSQQQNVAGSRPPLTDTNRTVSYESNVSNTHPPSGRTSRDSPIPPDAAQALNLHPGIEIAPSTDFSRSTSVTSLPQVIATRGLRSISSPAPGQSLMTSPIDETKEIEFLPLARPSISALPPAGSSLLAKRDSVLRNRQSQLATRNTGSPVEMLYSQPPLRSTSRLSLIDEAGSRSTSRLSNFDDGDSNLPSRSASRFSLSNMHEDMTLSQRRALIQQQSMALPPDHRVAASDNFDAHLPQRGPSAVPAQKRESMLASFRQSMRQEVAINALPTETVESRRADMMMEKQQAKMTQQYSEASKMYQENAFDQAMRRRDMQELHKEAMRRMQANANRHVS